VLVLLYTLLIAAVTFVLHIDMLVKIIVVVAALILFGLILGRSTAGHPPFGTEVDEEDVVRPHSARMH
jgi:hypothetical protein